MKLSYSKFFIALVYIFEIQAIMPNRTFCNIIKTNNILPKVLVTITLTNFTTTVDGNETEVFISALTVWKHNGQYTKKWKH